MENRNEGDGVVAVFFFGFIVFCFYPSSLSDLFNLIEIIFYYVSFVILGGLILNILSRPIEALFGKKRKNSNISGPKKTLDEAFSDLVSEEKRKISH